MEIPPNYIDRNLKVHNTNFSFLVVPLKSPDPKYKFLTDRIMDGWDNQVQVGKSATLLSLQHYLVCNII